MRNWSWSSLPTSGASWHLYFGLPQDAAYVTVPFISLTVSRTGRMGITYKVQCLSHRHRKESLRRWRVGGSKTRGPQHSCAKTAPMHCGTASAGLEVQLQDLQAEGG